jgi:hypothetical protein
MDEHGDLEFAELATQKIDLYPRDLQQQKVFLRSGAMKC